MFDIVHAATHTLARTADGAGGWSQFVQSVGRTIQRNEGLLPLVGIAIVLAAVFAVIMWANLRFAHKIERFWQRRHPGTDHKH